MTPSQVEQVQASFRQVAAIQDQAAALFYERLFATDPTAAPLFAKSDMALQGRKLMAALTMVVAGLSRPETIVPRAQELARRHVGYGVTEAQYGTVGAALLWTLEQGLGSVWTPALGEAWTAAYTMLADVMISAAREA